MNTTCEKSSKNAGDEDRPFAELMAAADETAGYQTTIWDENQGRREALVITMGDRIVDILPPDSLPDAVLKYKIKRTIDTGDMLLAPAFIDLQINGCGGVTFTEEPTLEALESMVRTNHRSGTACHLPTLVTCSHETMTRALEAMREFHRLYGKEAVPGIHLEGPFISDRKSGIHDRKHVRDLDDDTLKLLLDFRDEIALMTVSPERLTQKQMEALKEAGIRLSIGHSALDYHQARPALDAYFTAATHLYNAMTTVIDARTPGILAAAALSDLYGGIIADCRHVHPDLVRLARRMFGRKLFLVTDALASAGAGSDFRQFRFSGKTVYVRDEGYCSDESGTLAGSSLTMNQGVKNLVRHCGVELPDALAMASKIPAQVLGLSDRGAIRPGMRADFAILDENFQVDETVFGGRTVYVRSVSARCSSACRQYAPPTVSRSL